MSEWGIGRKMMIGNQTEGGERLGRDKEERERGKEKIERRGRQTEIGK